MFVVKGNAYGHGAAVCARAAEQARLADWLGVSSVEEGVALREAGLKLPILVLGSLFPFESFLAAAEHGLTPTIASLEGSAEIGRSGTWYPAKLGLAIYLGDELRTPKPGRLRVVFQDDSVLTLGDDSHVVVDEQVFDPNQGTVRSFMRLLRGKNSDEHHAL